MLHRKRSFYENNSNENSPIYGSRFLETQLPKHKIPNKSLDPRTAYEIIKDELMMDGNSKLNLATFVTTWMEPEAEKLMNDTFSKNMIDKDEYPQTAEIEMRCVNILANLFNASADVENENSCGCSTIGSSEAAMLAGLAMKWKWREKRRAQNKKIDKPNLVMTADVQLCWEKFCVYWDVEQVIIPMSKEDKFILSPAKITEYCNENTVGVIGILGTTYTGEFQDIETLNNELEKLNQQTGWDIPLHVDAASGGFIAPFLNPDLKWDFRLKWVKSINVSGHKFGLVYPGVGWALWKDWSYLPKELIFHVNYLGGDMPTFALNFSRPGNTIIGQYYNFIRLGFDGYKKIHSNSMKVANFLKEELESTGIFESILKKLEMPLVAFYIKEEYLSRTNVYDISEKLRHRGWLIPAYTLPSECSDISILRIVCKEGFSYDLSTILINDIKSIISSENIVIEKENITNIRKIC